MNNYERFNIVDFLKSNQLLVLAKSNKELLNAFDVDGSCMTMVVFDDIDRARDSCFKDVFSEAKLASISGINLAKIIFEYISAFKFNRIFILSNPSKSDIVCAANKKTSVIRFRSYCVTDKNNELEFRIRLTGPMIYKEVHGVEIEEGLLEACIEMCLGIAALSSRQEDSAEVVFEDVFIRLLNRPNDYNVIPGRRPTSDEIAESDVALVCSVFVERSVRIAKECLVNHRDTVNKFLSRYIGVLINKRGRLVGVDEYGDVDYSEWNKEVQVFVKNKCHEICLFIKRTYERELFRMGELFGPEKIVEYIINDMIDELNGSSVVVCDRDGFEKMSGIDFENYVMKKLVDIGWNVRSTPVSGDFGGDVIAERNGETVVVQCKNWKDPVGNSAVQEVFSAKEYYRCGRAIVVSVNGFTKAARRLAASTNVELLCVNEIGELF